MPYQPESYWESLLRTSPDLRGVGWPDLSLAFNEVQYRARLGAMDRAAKGANTERVLDVGSGTGYWIAFWHARGATTVDGVDLTEAAVTNLTSTFPDDRFAVLDISAGVPGGGPFTTISAIDVLLHIVDDERYARALHNLRSAAADGARLILLEPVTEGPAPAFDAGHSRIRSKAMVEKALGDAGWRLESMRPAVWLLARPVEETPRFACRLLHLAWRVTQRTVRGERAGMVVGALLYPIDRVLSRLPWGPSNKMLVAVAVERPEARAQEPADEVTRST